MMNHPTNIEKYSRSVAELWEAIGNLHYDTLTKIFAILSKKFEKDAFNDLRLHHPKVAERLAGISVELKKILEHEIQPLADLCRPYNEKESSTKYSKTVETYNGSLEELWEDIGNLDYDTLTQLFTILSKKFESDAFNNLRLHHPKTAYKLASISVELKKILEYEVQPLADLCRPYNEKGIR